MSGCPGLGLAVLLVICVPLSLRAERFVDAIVAEVDLRTIAASDIGLARALGLYGLEQASGSIGSLEIDRFIDAQLIIAASVRLNINPPAEVVEQAWRAAEARLGGAEAFQRWLSQKGIGEDWAKRMVDGDTRRNYFAQLRFARFVFVPEETIDKALGPGRDGPEAREQVRERLRKEQAARDLERWLEEQRKRAKIRRFTDGGVSDPLAPNPFNQNRP